MLLIGNELEMRIMNYIRLLIAAAFTTVAVPAVSAEAIKYTYDSRGRLIKVETQGGPANGATTTYRHDAASNRTNVTTTNAPVRVVVVPLNGYTIIPLN